MGLPVRLQIVNRVGERVVGVAIKDGHLVLRAVLVNCITMAETVGIVIPDNRLPVLIVEQFQLHSEAESAAVFADSGISSELQPETGRQSRIGGRPQDLSQSVAPDRDDTLEDLRGTDPPLNAETETPSCSARPSRCLRERGGGLRSPRCVSGPRPVPLRSADGTARPGTVRG